MASKQASSGKSAAQSSLGPAFAKQGGARTLVIAAALGLVAFALAACSTPSAPNRPPPPSGPSSIPGPSLPAPPPTVTRDGISPPFLAGRELTRIGILLPFSARPDQALAMFQAAELAIFEQGNPDTLLIPRDSGATEQSAEEAARLLLRAGADVILGPLQREQVRGAHRAAGRVPVIGFSNDRTVAGEGTYLLSIPPEEEVARIAEFATRRGLRSFALLAPSSELGRRVEAAFRKEITARGATLAVVQTYASSTERDAAGAARTLAGQVRAGNVQAILIAESGAALRATGPALLAGGLDLSRVQLLGIGGWATGDALREPTLARGWYVAPDPAVRAGFEQRYRTAYGQAPARLASLAYDGVALVAYLTKGRGTDGISRTNLERGNGFGGVDGMFRFRGDGTVERALAVLEVRQTGPATIDPAPRVFTSNGGF
jgi:branched-chain amino acid transport system substrate-binding protein